MFYPKIGHMAVEWIKDYSLPSGLCNLNICICMYRGLKQIIANEIYCGFKQNWMAFYNLGWLKI